MGSLFPSYAESERLRVEPLYETGGMLDGQR